MRMEFLRIPHIDLDGVNRTVNSFCISGETMWICHLWIEYWDGVKSGELSINPKILFRQKTVLDEYVN
jgi:hypothetical protein